MVPSRVRIGGKKSVFVDGEAGTTGLQVRERLDRHDGIEVVSLEAAKRKDVEARREIINSVDAVVLCLPDDAAREAVALAESNIKIVDASTAHRIADDWVYGFPELCEGQTKKIASASRVSNPGCYATGFIALARPLVDAGLIKPETKLAVSAISGYSGGGKALCKIHEEDHEVEPWGAYGLGLDHKHLPEMAKHSHLEAPPLFLPAVGHFAQGMVVSLLLPEAPDNIHEVLHEHYTSFNTDGFITVHPPNLDAIVDSSLLNRNTFLDPTKLNGSNDLDIFVFQSPKHKTAVLAARLDNLGKGASGAAVQNLNIMLGLDHRMGLDPLQSDISTPL